MSGVLASHQHGKSRVRVGRTFRSSSGTCSWRTPQRGARRHRYPVSGIRYPVSVFAVEVPTHSTSH